MRLGLAVVLAAMLTACGAFAASAPAQDAEPEECTITGTDEADVLEGTPEDDVICALAGDDTIAGLAGDDILIGGRGSDLIDGGDGADIASYRESRSGITIDIEMQRTGNDGAGGVDDLVSVESVIGSPKPDAIVGSDEPNFIDGVGGADVIRGNARIFVVIQ